MYSRWRRAHSSVSRFFNSSFDEKVFHAYDHAIFPTDSQWDLSPAIG